MFRKAGIILGVVILALAGCIYWFFGDVGKTDAGGVKSPPVSFESEQPTQPTQPTQPKETNDQNTQPQQQQQPQQPVADTTPKQVFTEIDESDLGNPSVTRTEVMVVAKKKVIVMDNNYSEDTGKQLVYVVELLYGDELMNLYLNGSAYQTLKVGDKLKVDYAIYKNDNGVTFPVINEVELVQ